VTTHPIWKPAAITPLALTFTDRASPALEAPQPVHDLVREFLLIIQRVVNRVICPSPA
jgi:hypothetical protein